MLIVGKGKTVQNCREVSSAKVKDIRWDLIHKEIMKELRPYKKFLKESFYPEEELKRMYPTKKEYIKSFKQFYTDAVLTPDGKWHEPESFVTLEKEARFRENYEEKFIKTANPEWQLTIVDCYI